MHKGKDLFQNKWRKEKSHGLKKSEDEQIKCIGKGVWPLNY